MYVVLNGNLLSCYKDKKIAKQVFNPNILNDIIHIAVHHAGNIEDTKFKIAVITVLRRAFYNRMYFSLRILTI